MTPYKRDTNNTDLYGSNIKLSVKKGKEYFYYRMPDGTLQPLEHGDRKASIEAAHALNRVLRPSGLIVDRVLNHQPRHTQKNPLLIEVISEFQSEWLSERGYSAQTLKTRVQKLNTYRQVWPHKKIGEIDTFTIASFLRKFSAESARHHRNVLEPLFRFAASRGYETQRPMIDIEKRTPEKRKRARHTWEGHLAIYNAAPVWLKRAILIALYTLQRRGDLVDIKIKEQVNLTDRTIRILQQKTRNYDKPVFIDIGMGDELLSVVTAAIKSDVPCPYLIHHRPLRSTAETRAAKPHPFAVLPSYLSKAYSKVRDEVGVYNHLPPIQRPGIHSLRALGIWLYSRGGYSDEYIMALAGHASEKMKAHYEDGHVTQMPLKVNADLSLSGIDLSDVNWETGLSKSLQKIADSDGDL